MYSLNIDPKYKQYSLITGVFLLGLIVGLVVHQHPPALTKDVRSNESGYRFINPLLECENASFENRANLAELQNKLEERINEGKNKSEVRQVSVYFRDLNNGPWFGINENEKFSPASLIKVPVMIAYFKLAETNPEILDKQITVTHDVM
jgi:beta-lactamase class A